MSVLDRLKKTAHRRTAQPPAKAESPKVLKIEKKTNGPKTVNYRWEDINHPRNNPVIIEGETSRIMPPLHQIPTSVNKKRTREEFDAGHLI